MASLVLGGLGAIGGSFFGPMGTRIGWMIGSALGNALSQPTIKGPRQTDLRVQVSTYGKMIPIVFGDMRLANNVIWSTPKQEHEHSSGKGGPSQTTYSYTISQAISLGEGALVGIRKVWANGKLIYNNANTANASTIFASGQAFMNGFVVYLGDETQLPDPTMESYLGIGNVPAYRGQAYVVIKDFDLTPYGGEPPNFEFEVVSGGGAVKLRRVSTWATPVPRMNNNGGGSNELSGEVVDGVLTVQHWESSGAGGYTDTGYCTITKFDMEGNQIGVQTLTATGSLIAYSVAQGAVNNHHVAYTYNNSGTKLWLVDGSVGQNIIGPEGSSLSWQPQGQPAVVNGNTFLLGHANVSGHWYLSRYPGLGASQDADKVLVLDSYLGAGAAINLAVSSDGSIFIIMHNGAGSQLWLSVDTDLNPVTFYNSGVPSVGGDTQGYWSFAVHGDQAIIARAGTSPIISLYSLDAATGTVTYIEELSVAESTQSFIAVDDAPMVMGNNGVIAFNDSLQGSSVALSTIVTNLCARVDVTASQIDVTQLVDIVDGYLIDQQMSARAATEQLMLAYHFDAVETDA